MLRASSLMAGLASLVLGLSACGSDKDESSPAPGGSSTSAGPGSTSGPEGNPKDDDPDAQDPSAQGPSSKDSKGPAPKEPGSEGEFDCSKLEVTGNQVGQVPANVTLLASNGRQVSLHDFCNETLVIMTGTAHCTS